MTEADRVLLIEIGKALTRQCRLCMGTGIRWKVAPVDRWTKEPCEDCLSLRDALESVSRG